MSRLCFIPSRSRMWLERNFDSARAGAAMDKQAIPMRPRTSRLNALLNAIATPPISEFIDLGSTFPGFRGIRRLLAVDRIVRGRCGDTA